MSEDMAMPSGTLQLHHSFWPLFFFVVVFLPIFACVLPGGEVKEHGFLGQPGSEVPVHTGLVCAFLQRQLRTVQTGRQGEGGERETAESTGRAGQERARKATVIGREMEKCVTEEAEAYSIKSYIRESHYSRLKNHSSVFIISVSTFL